MEQSSNYLAYSIIPGYACRGTGKALNTSIVILGVFDADNLRDTDGSSRLSKLTLIKHM